MRCTACRRSQSRRWWQREFWSQAGVLRESGLVRLPVPQWRHQVPESWHHVLPLPLWSVGYGAQVWSYLLVLHDCYPDSDPLALLPEVPIREDPVRLRSEDDLRRSRLTVAFRLPLASVGSTPRSLQRIVHPVAIDAFATCGRGRCRR